MVLAIIPGMEAPASQVDSLVTDILTDTSSRLTAQVHFIMRFKCINQVLTIFLRKAEYALEYLLWYPFRCTAPNPGDWSLVSSHYI